MSHLPAVRPSQSPVAAIFQSGQLAALVDEWLASLDVSPATRTTYANGMNRFLRWLESNSTAGLTPTTLRQRRDELKASADTAAGSVNTWLAGVRSFFNWALESGHAPYNPAAGLRGARRRGTSKQYKRDELTAGEIRRVLATFDDSPTGRRDKAMVALMAYCALRQIEIHRADKGDLKTRQGRLVLWVQGKGRSEKDEFVVLPIPAEEAVRDWLAVHPLKNAGPLFVGIGNRSKGKRLGLRAIRKIVKEHYHLVGVVGDGKTTHSLRHSAISAAIRNGATIQQVQAMARHSNISTTMIYFHETSRTTNPAEDFVRYE